MLAFKDQLQADVAALQEQAAGAGELTAATAERWEGIVLGLEDIQARLGHITAYVDCLGAADAGSEAYSREEAQLAQIGAEAEKAEVDLLHALKAAGDEIFAAFTGREKLRDAAHRLRRLRRRAQHTMPREQEMLAADLAVDGLHAWGRMYNTLSGKLDFEMKWPDGRIEQVPMAQWRALVSAADRRVGRAAFEAGNREWARIGDVCAAALNAIAGNRLTLNRYRGHLHYLEPALYQSQVDRETLEAMYGCDTTATSRCRGAFSRPRRGPWPHRHLVVRARGPPGAVKDSGELTYEAAADGGPRFPRVYPDLADYYERALESGWIESEKRPGKRPGGLLHRLRADRRAARLYDLWRRPARRLDPRPRDRPRVARLAHARLAAHGARATR